MITTKVLLIRSDDCIVVSCILYLLSFYQRLLQKYKTSHHRETQQRKMNEVKEEINSKAKFVVNII